VNAPEPGKSGTCARPATSGSVPTTTDQALARNSGTRTRRLSYIAKEVSSALMKFAHTAVARK